ncbi:acetyltransferase (GNAT) family protein [mine drainage metagenome]|uniref:Acetyltransferase (GNAT) family protein n=1 Tax=mine drainage metagenome TaxID=410659 RepID=A0A1J5Q9W1_9ZZZZ
MIRQIEASEAALLVPLNAVMQRLHAAARPDVFHCDASEAEVAEYFAETLARVGWFALVAEVEGRAVGYALCEVQRVEGNAMNRARVRGFLHHIAVAENARRRGVATALIEAAKARFRAEGATVWATTYWVWNEASVALMAKAGLTPAITLSDAAL